MVANVSGNSLGLGSTSFTTLGRDGVQGDAALGRGGEGAYVNLSNGNLVLQRRDEYVAGVGMGAQFVRTYNSQGLMNDAWSFGMQRKGLQIQLGATPAATTIVRTDQDGAQTRYSWDATSSSYINTDGAGAYDSLQQSGSDWIWTDGETRITERYDAAGVLRSSSDAAGNATTFTYNAQGKIASVTTASGEVTQYEYNGQLLKAIHVQDSAGIVKSRVYYEYDTLGRLSAVNVDLSPQDNAIADGKVYRTTYSYDGSSQRVITVLNQADNTRLLINYTLVGSDYRVSRISDGYSNTVYSYDTVALTTKVIDQLGSFTVYSHDSGGQLIQVRSGVRSNRPEGLSLQTYGYDLQGNLVSVIDAYGHGSTMQYDGHGNQVRVTDALGNSIIRSYDTRNQLSTETQVGADGIALGTERYVYEAGTQGRLCFRISAEGRVSEYRYDARGQLVTTVTYGGGTYAVASLGNSDVPSQSQMQTWAAAQDQTRNLRTDIAYDFRGQRSTLTTYDSVNASGVGMGGRVTQYVYSQAGELLQTIEPSTNSVTQYVYDGVGRLIATTAPSSDGVTPNVSTITYEPSGRKVVTSANGLRTLTNYWGYADNPYNVTTLNPDGSAPYGISYGYNVNGQLIRVVEAGQTRLIGYDDAGRKIGDVQADGATTQYIYDANGLLIKTIAYANRGAVVAPTQVAMQALASAADRTSWRVYDDAHRLVLEIDALGYVAKTEYDSQSRVIAVRQFATPIDTSGLTATTAISAATPATSAQDRVTRSIYDRDGLLLAVIDAEGYMQESRYNAAGQLVGVTRYASRVPGFSDANFETQLAAARQSASLLGIRPTAGSVDASSSLLYNARGQVIASVDAEGYLTESSYDANGNLAQTIRYATSIGAGTNISNSTLAAIRPPASAQDQKVTRQWDALNRLAQETEADGTVTKYAYDTAGNLVKTERAAGSTDARLVTKRYDVLGRLTGELSAEGGLQLAQLTNPTQAQVDDIWARYGTSHTYDTGNRRTSTVDANGNRTLYFYDSVNRLTHTVNALGEVIERRYNGLGQLTSTIQYAGRISTTSLSNGGLNAVPGTLVTVGTLVAAIANSALDQVTQYTYNNTGTLAQTTDALGFKRNYFYNAFRELIGQTETASSGATTTTAISYDHRGQVVSSTRDSTALALKTTFEYDAFGRQIRSTDAEGKVRSQTYDRLGRAITSTDAMQAVQRTSYDAFDRVLTQTDALGHVTSYTYDTAARTVSILTPEGYTLSTVSNRHGQKLLVTDARGVRTAYAYDANGNLQSVTTQQDGVPSITNNTNTYDKAGRLVRSVDANGVATELSYDAANRVIRRTRMGSSGAQVGGTANTDMVTTYSYDGIGRQLSVTDPNGTVTQMRYDAKGQLVEQAVDPAGLNLVTRYTYDAQGHTVSVTSPGGTLTVYSYDAAGRRTREQIDPAGLNLTRSYTYDKNDRVTSAVDANGDVTWYGYDAEGRSTFVVNGMGEVQETVYDAAGRIARVTRYKQPISAVGLGDLASVGPGPSGVDGRVRQRLIPGNGDATEYRIYNSDGWLTETVNALGECTTYVRDGAGNAIAQRRYATRVSTSTAAQWTSENGPVPVVDNANDQQSVFAYDLMGRLTYSTDGTGAAVRYEYDGNGNLLKKTSYAQPIVAMSGWDESNFAAALAAQQASTQNIVERFTYDTANRLATRTDGTGAVTKNVYDRNGNVVRVIRYAQAVNGTVTSPSPSTEDAVQDRVYDSANRLIYTVDAAGGVTRLDYDANGNVVRQTEFAPSINPPSSTSSQSAYNRSSVQSALANAESNTDNRVARRSYDAANRQVFVIDGDGAVTETNYAPHSTTTTRYAAIVYADQWPAQVSPDMVRAQVYPQAGLDRKEVQRFDAAGRLTLAIDGEGYATRTVYDGLGQRTKTVVYAQAMTAAAIAGSGDPIASAGRDRETNYQYDRAGRLTSTTDALQGRETSSWDALGNRVSFTNKAGSTWTYTWDGAGRMLSETQPGGVVNRMVYDTWGRLSARTEAANTAQSRTTRYEYDQVGRQVKTIFAPVGVYSESVGSLTGNDAAGYNPRVETVTSLSSETRYDALGNAIASRDTAGNWSYKSYDTMGRVRYDLDAEGYVTGYALNRWGDVLTLTRYAERPTLNVAGGAKIAPSVIAQALAGKNHAADRDILTTYDHNGRATQVQQPLVYNYDGQTGEQGFGRKTTYNQYDAFGNLTATLESLRSGQWATTTHVYDRIGQRTATVDALGYLTTMAYDASGNLTRQVEYSRQVAVGTPPDTAAGDRVTDYQYDVLGRKSAQIRRSVSFTTYNGQASTATALTNQTADLSTTYQYDALGNLTATVDAAGGATLSFYDALGRVIATVTPSANTGAGAGGSNNGAASQSAVTEYVRDALGNITATIQRANSDLIASGAQFVRSPTASGADRITYNSYDALGRVSSTVDAQNVAHNYSYDAQGHLAKEWQTVTLTNDDRTKSSQTLLKAYVYDKLGHQSHLYTLKQHDLEGRVLTFVDTETQYNAFGEATVRSVKMDGLTLPGNNEINEYDNAGRVWRSTVGDGVYKIMAYDLQGRQTVQLVGNGATSLAGIANVQAALALQSIQPGEMRRTDMRYDALGRLTQTIAPERVTNEASAISTREATMLATISKSESLDHQGDSTNVNQVDLVWRSLQNLGSGDVRITLTYRSPKVEYNNGGENQYTIPSKSGVKKSITVNAEQAINGYSFKWQSGTGVYGIEAVEGIQVEKLDLFGNWATVYNVAPAAAQTGTLNWSEVASPGYVWSEPGPGRIPVYRLNKPLLDTHFFTARTPERDSLFNQGWLDEGVAFYISAAPATGLVALYRLFNTGTNRCYYTSNAQERADKLASGAGWEDHGIEGYVGDITGAQPAGMTKLEVLQRNANGATGSANPDPNVSGSTDALYTLSQADRNLLVGVGTPDGVAAPRTTVLYAQDAGLKIEVSYPPDILSSTVLEWRPANSGAGWSQVPTTVQRTFGTAHQFDIAQLGLPSGTYEYRVRQVKDTPPGSPTGSISQDIGSGVFSIRPSSGATDPIPTLQGVAMGIATIDGNPWRTIQWPVPAAGSNVTFRYRAVGSTNWIVRTVGNGIFTQGDGRTTAMGAGQQGIALTMAPGNYEYEVISAIGTNGNVQHAQGRLTLPGEVGAASITSPVQSAPAPVNVTPSMASRSGVANQELVGYVWTTPAAGRVALRRYLLPQSGNNHITTADPNVIAYFENIIAQQNANPSGTVWAVREGIVGYVQTSASANTARLYQYSYSGDGATYRLSADSRRVGGYTPLNSQPPAGYQYTSGLWYQNSYQFDGYISKTPQEGTVALYEVYNTTHISGASTIGDFMTSTSVQEITNGANLGNSNAATATIGGVRITPANINGGNFPMLAWPAPEAGTRTTVTASPAVPNFGSPLYVYKNGTAPDGIVVQYPPDVGQGIALHTLQPGVTYTFDITIEYPATAQHGAYLARVTERITVPAEGFKGIASTPVTDVRTARANINGGSYPVLGWNAPAGWVSSVTATPAVPEFALPLYVFKNGFVDGHQVQFPVGMNQGIALHTLKPGTSYTFEILVQNPATAALGASPMRTIVRIDVPASGMQRAEVVGTTLPYVAPATVTLANASSTTARPVVSMQYDRWGNTTAVDDPRNSVTGQFWQTTYKYNANNQLIEQVRPQDNTEGAAITRVRYDQLGRQIGVQDPEQSGVPDGKGNWNITLHDAAGNLTSELHADGGRVDYRFNTFGDKVQSAERFDASRVVTTNYTYDKLSRLVQTDLAQAITSSRVDSATGGVTANPGSVNASDAQNGATVVKENQTTLERVEYDEAGRRIRVVNGNNEATRYRYDAAGNLLRSAQETVYDVKGPYPVNPPPLAHAVEYRYDALGQKTWQMDANGTVQTWNWDRFGHLLSSTDQGVSTNFQYNQAGQLARTWGSAASGQATGQNIAYRYDGAGQLIGIEDAAIGQVTTYSYDLAGNRIREKITQKTLQENGLLADVVYQDNRMVYDAQNQLRAVLNGHADVRIDYDRAGNRTKVQTHVINTVGSKDQYINDSTTVYGYDAMNRQISATETKTVTQTISQSTTPTAGQTTTQTSTAQSSRGYGYDLAGNRTLETSTGQGGSAPVSYTYDDLKRVVRTEQSGALTQTFAYDGAGRLSTSESTITTQDSGVLREWRYNRYDVLGQTQDSQIVTRNAGTGSLKSTASIAYHDANGQTGLGYDAAGNLRGYTQNTNGTVQTTKYENARIAGGYVQKSATTVQGGASVKLTTNRDANGFVSEISQVTGSNGTWQDSQYYRSFVNDSAGNAVYVNQGGSDKQLLPYGPGPEGPVQGTVAASRLVSTTSDWKGGWVGGSLGPGHVQRQIVVGGQVIARYGDAPAQDLSMEGLNATGGTGGQAPTYSTPVTYANTVDVNLSAPAVNRGVGSQGVSLYTTQEGDSLQAIARTQLGDSRLWYLIADANSLTVTAEAKLQAGQTLRIPQTTLSSSRADTFEPWDPAKAIGSQQPNMPVPAGADGACGGFGQVIMAAIAVVVTVYTAGAAASYFGVAMGQMSAASVSVAAGSAAVGSIASQAVGNTLGIQNGFDWKAVGLSALSAGITQGISPGAIAGQSTSVDWGTAAARAAATNALSQGAGIVLGLQKSFDWKGVAASAVGAGVGNYTGDALQNATIFDSLGSAAQLARASVSGFAAGTAAALARGGRIAIGQVATDAFGNALGQSLVDAIAPSDPLGNFIAQRESEWQRDQVYGLGNMGARLPGMGEGNNAAIHDWSDSVDVGIINAANNQGAYELAMRRADVEQQVQLEILGGQAREDSLHGAQLLQTGGTVRGGALRGFGSGGFEMVRNGNWDAALNIGADPFGVLPDIAGLRQDMATMGRIQAENRINDMRQRMVDAGMKNVPMGYSQDLMSNGSTVRNYGATIDDLQTRYEGFVRENRLRETWGDDYRSLRLGKSQMTVLEFEKRVLDVQQSATDRAYTKGVDAIARGELLVKDGDYARTLGNFIDQQVRGQLRTFAGIEGINDSMASNIWAVNRSIRSSLVEGRGIPDNRLGYNLFADTTLALKNGYTEQIMKWNAIRPDANYLIIRPTNMPNGGSYVIPRTAIQPYTPSRLIGRGL